MGSQTGPNTRGRQVPGHVNTLPPLGYQAPPTWKDPMKIDVLTTVAVGAVILLGLAGWAVAATTLRLLDKAIRRATAAEGKAERYRALCGSSVFEPGRTRVEAHTLPMPRVNERHVPPVSQGGQLRTAPARRLWGVPDGT